MYKIRGADQNEYGPVSAEIVRQWIAQRRANAQTLVQAEGSADWRPLSAFPEFSLDLQAPAAPPPVSGAVPRPASVVVGPNKTSGLAIASLVLGILGLFSCGLTALVGLILGIVSLVKIRDSKGQLRGEGLAIAGTCVSGVFLLLGPTALLLPALSKAKARATQIRCMSNMKQIGLAARMWSSDHNETFPPDFLSMSNEMASLKILVCPSDPRHTAAADWSQFGPQNVSYEYLTPGMKEGPAGARTVVFRCPIHNSVGYSDGSVEQMGRAGALRR